MSAALFQVARPSAALAPFVEVIWGMRAGMEPRRVAVLPNGFTELMVNFGSRQKVWAYGERDVDEDLRLYWVAGIQDRPLVIGSPDGCDHLGVRFRPGGAHAFFGIPMSELTDQVVDLDLIVGREAAEQVRDRLAARPSHEARAREVERWLLERRYAIHPYHASVLRALDLIQQSGFRTRIGEVCGRLGLSNRHLIEQFRDVVGLTPKTMSRVQRFHAVMAATEGRRPGEVAWAPLAYRLGFSDQAHLVREFRRFSGVTPMEFLARRVPQQTHITVDADVANRDPRGRSPTH